MRTFAERRDWAGHHDPKSLIVALVGEVGELSELFQLLRPTRRQHWPKMSLLRQRCADETGDVLLYLVRLADVLPIDVRGYS